LSNINLYTNESPEQFDLAVVGAGPAGSLIAALAAETGFSTVILEQKSLPRPKPCGGLISSRALSMLPDDLDLKTESAEPINTINVFRRNQCFSYYSEISLGLLIKREQFDHILARYACQKGAVLLEKHTMHRLQAFHNNYPDDIDYCLTAAEAGAVPITARYVIGADGAMSRCGLLSGLRKKRGGHTGWGLTEFVKPGNEKIRPGTLNFYPLPFLGGMGWSFHGSRWINRGVGGVVNSRLLKKAYDHLFPGDKGELSPVGWPLPFLGPLKKAGKDNLLLAGDAAGLIEPFSGEGLYNSFKSATLAFSALLRAEIEKKPAGVIYNQLYQGHFRKAFFSALAGAILLHSRSAVNPASLPCRIARLMENKLWFNQPFNHSL